MLNGTPTQNFPVKTVPSKNNSLNPTKSIETVLRSATKTMFSVLKTLTFFVFKNFKTAKLQVCLM